MKPSLPTLADATLARLPIDRLDALESLRGDLGLSVSIRRDGAWVAWDRGKPEVIARLLPVSGVRFFVAFGSEYHALGRWLPSRDVPTDLTVDAINVARAVVPEPVKPEPPGGLKFRTIEPLLTLDDQPRPCSAWLGPLASLGAWADRAPTAEIARLRGAIQKGRVLLFGNPPPWLPGGRRLWGRSLLCPLGTIARPSMTDGAWAEALGLMDEDRALLLDGGRPVEVVAGSAVGPISRASIRLACRGVTP